MDTMTERARERRLRGGLQRMAEQLRHSAELLDNAATGRDPQQGLEHARMTSAQLRSFIASEK